MARPALVPLIGTLAVFASQASAADLPAGRQYFAANCAACHSTTRGVNRTGPSLAGLIGRKSGSLSGFNFSPALKGANIRWTTATLDSWLRRPTNDVHTTRMTISIPSETDRQNLIAYLRTL